MVRNILLQNLQTKCELYSDSFITHNYVGCEGGLIGNVDHNYKVIILLCDFQPPKSPRPYLLIV